MNNEQIKTIYYRGYLKSCNYTCVYCPFSKAVSLQKDLNLDKEALYRFYKKISSMTSVETVIFVPYGEAMLHSYYHRTLARISRLLHIKRVSIQTNLSFSMKGFLTELMNEDADLTKISLWASYHEGQTDISKIIKQCSCLHKVGIRFCIGAVGDIHKIKKLCLLKESLPEGTYFWINAIEGMGVRYGEEEIEAFKRLDPMFSLEVKRIKADFSSCTGGKHSVFIDAAGNITSCNLSKVILGNLYTDEFEVKSCRQRACSCYLAYSCRTDLHELKTFMGENQQIRLGNSAKPRRAVFFDLDGTLTNEMGEISESTVIMLQQLKNEVMLFLATARPFISARHICREVIDLFTGGVFASGADLRIFHAYKETILFEENILFYKELFPSFINEGMNCRIYQMAKGIYKMTIKNAGMEQVTALLGSHVEKFHCEQEGNLIGITDKKASKLSGLLTIMKKLSIQEDDVTVVGNGENDIPMLSYFKNSVAVDSAVDKWIPLYS